MTAEQAPPRHGRLPWPAPADLDSPAREVYDAIAGGPRATGPRLFKMTSDDGRLEGPFNSMLSAPSVGFPLQELGAAIRYRTSLTNRVREIAILLVAARHRSDYEWYAHEAVGAACGLTADELAALADRRVADTFDDVERATVAAANALLDSRNLDDDQHAAAVSALGEAGLTELVVLIGYYETLDLLIRAWDAPLPAGVSVAFPDRTPKRGN